MFQCPTSGFLLFYNYTMVYNANNVIVVSMPYLGLSSFLLRNSESVKWGAWCFNALPRAFFFSTAKSFTITKDTRQVSMPYLGLSSFLRYVSASLDFTGFANPFLRVIIWQFDFQPFFSCYFPYSYFSHILFCFVRFLWHIYLNMIPAILQ